MCCFAWFEPQKKESANNSSLGLSALQGEVINPIAGGTRGALDRYADQILKSIERDGFFVRVPAGKQFYVYG
jgi:hypothetical protein